MDLILRTGKRKNKARFPDPAGFVPVCFFTLHCVFTIPLLRSFGVKPEVSPWDTVTVERGDRKARRWVGSPRSLLPLSGRESGTIRVGVSATPPRCLLRSHGVIIGRPRRQLPVRHHPIIVVLDANVFLLDTTPEPFDEPDYQSTAHAPTLMSTPADSTASR